jgi:hypothetical protein
MEPNGWILTKRNKIQAMDIKSFRSAEEEMGKDIITNGFLYLFIYRKDVGSQNGFANSPFKPIYWFS